MWKNSRPHEKCGNDWAVMKKVREFILRTQIFRSAYWNTGVDLYWSNSYPHTSQFVGLGFHSLYLSKPKTLEWMSDNEKPGLFSSRIPSFLSAYWNIVFQARIETLEVFKVFESHTEILEGSETLLYNVLHDLEEDLPDCPKIFQTV